MREKFFELSMFWRIGYGVVRIIFAFILLKVVNTPLTNLFTIITKNELVEDPTDLPFALISSFLEAHPVEITYFFVAYLLFWGIVDIVLSISLLKHQTWAFPVMLFLIAMFVAYALVRLTNTHSLVLAGVIVIDLMVFWLVFTEYKRLQKTPPKAHIS